MTDLPKELTGAPFCAVAKPISWSRKDTQKTVLQIKELNAVYKTLCM